MAFNHSPQIVKDNLVLYLDAGSPKSYGGSGTTWTDISRNGNNGTLVNGVSASGGAMSLNGVNQYVSSLNLSSVDMTNFTISVWLNPSSLSGYVTVFDTVGRNLSLWIGSQFYGVGGSNSFYVNNFNWKVNEWCYVTIVRTSSSTTLIKNNFQVTENLTSGSSFTNQLFFGSNPSGGGVNFAGKYGVIQLYNRALSQAEILQNYNATKGRYGL